MKNLTRILPLLFLVAALVDADDLRHFPEKPSWLTEVSLTVTENWDSNVYLTNNRGPVGNDIANRASMVTQVEPKIGADFASLLEGSSEDFSIQHLTLAYAPEIVRYHDVDGEDYERHTVQSGLEASYGNLHLKVENQFRQVDGSRETPQYTARSCFATGAIRERRDQIQDRAHIELRYDGDGWFFRPTASFLYYDLNSDVRVATGSNAGWQNYVDRYDVSGGTDLGVRVFEGFYLTAGYRHGHQHQGTLFFNPASSSNDYDRLLFGFEGKALPWLKTSLQAGPDFHSYDNSVATGHELSMTRFYLDASLTAEPTSTDKIQFKAKQWQWVSGSGIATYQDTLYTLKHEHTWCPALKTSTALNLHEGDYDSPTKVNDTLYTLEEEAAWTINTHMTASLRYSFSHNEDNTDSGIAEIREYDDHLVSLSLRATY